MKTYIITVVLFTLGLVMMLAAPDKAHSAVITEDVYEFGEWYGVVNHSDGKLLGREITVFSHSNMASLVVKLDKKKRPVIEISAGLRGVKPGREIVIFIDDGKGITEVNSKLIRGFRKGYVAEMHFTDTDNEQRKELFSLKGFSRAYRWLTK